MKEKGMKKLFLAVLFIAATTLPALAQIQPAGTIIDPDNKLIQYTGRFNTEDPKAPVMYWSGSFIRAKFQGTSIKAILDDSTGKDTYHIIIDDQPGSTLKCKKGKHIYALAQNLEDKGHTVLIYKRTEYDVGNTAFNGFILDNGKKLLYPLYRPSRRIEFYGDSITCGMGNEDESRKNNSDMYLENHYMTYGAMTARNLMAEHTSISKSGIGFMVSWAPVIMPEIYDRINPNDPQSKWDYSKWTPDVVVVNLGTNDCWLVNRFDPEPQGHEIIKNYVDFIAKIRDKYPKAEIFCALGNMSSTSKTSKFPGYIENAVKYMNENWNDSKIHSVIFPYKETDGHPTISEHEAMAKQLTAEIKKVMNW